ncbi:nicotinate-nucleotide adenylyltransferase [Xanthomonas maliensis]|nr:nicotinate-nucleotide adenylyltransferase [Xanthomonas maliensis]KAB7770085.1 nicotinate-nucleotide adenylyltransferase [Xanthomonas maliensis]
MKAGTRDPGPGTRESGGAATGRNVAPGSESGGSASPRPDAHSDTAAVAVPGSRVPGPESRLHLYYGGTFDPIHCGHLAIACAARDALKADVHVVPAADPPHRVAPGATAAQRARMVELALAGQPGLHLDRRELQRAGHDSAPSYTVDTLRDLRQSLGPTPPIAWLLGADAFVGMQSWHQWQALFALAHLVIAARPGTALALDDAPALAAATQDRWVADPRGLIAAPSGRLWRLQQPLRAESASSVRAGIAAGAAWQAAVPAAVADFIEREGLYGCARRSS